jgi:predicted permease
MFYITFAQSLMLCLHLFALSLIEKLHKLLEGGNYGEAVLYILIFVFAVLALGFVLGFVHKKLFPKD